MCSFLVSSIRLGGAALAALNERMQSRGPDFTTIRFVHNVTWVHNLQWSHGSEPTVSANGAIVAVTDGAIYNGEDSSASVLAAYERFGAPGLSNLDGEWAAVLVDAARKVVVLSSDTFGTKPLWYGMHGREWAIASYRSAIPTGFLPMRASKNEIVEFEMTAHGLRRARTHFVHEFELRPHKTQTRDWEAAFFRAVTKRLPYGELVVTGSEAADAVVATRRPYMSASSMVEHRQEYEQRELDFLRERCEANISIWSDDTLLLSAVCARARHVGASVYLSDVAQYKDNMDEALAEVEIVAGAHGVQARHPFLDVTVVQETLWLAVPVETAIENLLSKRGNVSPANFTLETTTRPCQYPESSLSSFFFDSAQVAMHEAHLRDLIAARAQSSSCQNTGTSALYNVNRVPLVGRCDEWTGKVVEALDMAARLVRKQTGFIQHRCRAYRALATFFKGQAAPVLQGLHRCPLGLTPIKSALQHNMNASRGWRDLALYALANLAHTVEGGRWDARVFVSAHPELSSTVDSTHWMSMLFGNSTTTGFASPQSTIRHSDIFRVVTVASHERSELDQLRRSCREAGLRLDVLGIGDPRLTVDGYWHDWKLKLLQEYVASLNDMTPLVFVDAYDVLLTPSAHAIFRDHVRREILFSTEKECWPDAAICKAYPEWSRLNSGSFLGRAGAIRAMLDFVVQTYGDMAICGADDQRVYQRYAIDMPGAVALDYESHVFRTMHGFNWTVAFDNDGAPELLTISNAAARRPAVLHFNSHDGKQMYRTYVQAYESKRSPRTLVVSLAKSTQRKLAMVNNLRKAGLSARFVEAVNGDDLKRTAVPQEDLIAEWRSGKITIRALDWTDSILGNMSEALTRRILACAASHLLAIREANLAGTFPVLITEDDVDFSWLPPDFNVLYPDDEHWTVLQLAYLNDDPHLAANFVAARCLSRRTTVRRTRCSPPESLVGSHAYLVSQRGADMLLRTYFREATTLDLTPALNFAADYLLFDLDAVYAAAKPALAEVYKGSTIGSGHANRAARSRALALAVHKAPCDAGVVLAAAARNRYQNEDMGGRRFVLYANLLVEIPVDGLLSRYANRLSSLLSTHPKVDSLITRAFESCDRTCRFKSGIFFPSPLRCFVHGLTTLDGHCPTHGCVRLGLRGVNCFSFCNAIDAARNFDYVALPCGQFKCALINDTATTATPNPAFPDNLYAEDLSGRAVFSRDLANMVAFEQDAALFHAIADSWDTLSRVLSTPRFAVDVDDSLSSLT